MKMRVISAIVALIIFIPIFIMGGNIFKIAIYIVSMLGLKEFLDAREKRKLFPDFVKLIAYIWLSILFFEFNFENLQLIIDYRYITSLFLVLMIPLVLYHDKTKYNINDACYIISGIMFLGLSFSLAVIYRNISLEFIIFLFLITSLTDTFAYITGRLIGRHKLIEVISPNKTWEGFIGGSIISTFICTNYYITLINPNVSIWLIMFVILFLTIIGQLGDLFFSSIKRYYEIKDFSNIMPGHGGILDRLDSIIFVILTYSLFINYI